MTVRYLALDDYLAIAVEVTGQQVETLINVAKTDLADSALHAPAASFSGEEFYPDFVDKAAVLSPPSRIGGHIPVHTHRRLCAFLWVD